jgi:hypothetical protein
LSLTIKREPKPCSWRGFFGETAKIWNMCDIFAYRTSRIM